MEGIVRASGVGLMMRSPLPCTTEATPYHTLVIQPSTSPLLTVCLNRLRELLTWPIVGEILSLSFQLRLLHHSDETRLHASDNNLE